MYPYLVLPTCPEKANDFQGQGFGVMIAKLLAARGFTTAAEAQALFYPDKNLSHDPFLLQSMETAVLRLEEAIEKDEMVAIYGDYDVDGITATALLTHYLRSRGLRVIPYIPHRIGEGYGLNETALLDLQERGVSLVVTVDCGISGKDQVIYANELGLEIIITDHHSCPPELPPALAVINSRLGNYPCPELAGVGVALKLAQALSHPEDWEDVFFQYSDLVAVGTVADVMPLKGENRYFVKIGLEKLNQYPQLGIAKLLGEIDQGTRQINTGTIGYNLAPRINAAGRLDRTEIALALLLTEEESFAQDCATMLCELNWQRQEIEGEIFRQCLEYLEENPPDTLVFLENETWHAGVVGIVASRLGERYSMPTVMVCCRDGIGKGSCRTFGEVNLYELLAKVGDLLLGYGGHAQAAGFTVAQENIPDLKIALKAEMQKYSNKMKTKTLNLDICCEIKDITLEETEFLENFEPTGGGCLRPSFLIESALVVAGSLVGGGKHLRLRLRQDDAEILGVCFHYQGEPVQMGIYLDIAFHLQVNHYRGESNPQLQIFSMCPSQKPDRLYQEFQSTGRINDYLDEYEEKYQNKIYLEEENVLALYDRLKEEKSNKSFTMLCQDLENIAQIPVRMGELALGILRELRLVQLSSEKNTFTVKRNSGQLDLDKSNLWKCWNERVTLWKNY
ncbi:MAG: single-stranded-DNA-specific exonuclease RecJ [Eubacteriales bacterium]